MNQLPFVRIVAAASIVGGLLLVAPWVPPQLAFGAFIATMAVTILTYWALDHVGSEIAAGWREAGEEMEPDPGEVERVQRQYVDGELSEEEFEEELERLEDEIQ